MRKFNVNVNGKKYEVEIEEVNSFARPSVQAAEIPAAASAPAPVQAAAPAPVAAAPAAAVPQGGTKILSPMPGTVLKFLVPAGTAVKALQPVLILEAMKMEQEIVAPCAGTVTFTVSAGAQVENKAVIAVVS